MCGLDSCSEVDASQLRNRYPLQYVYALLLKFISFQAELLSSLNINPELLSSGETITSSFLTRRHLADSFNMNDLDILSISHSKHHNRPNFFNNTTLDDDVKDNIETLEKEARFQKWLKTIFRPSYQYFFGERQLNPFLYFHLTKLSPGFVGGVISSFNI